MARPVELTAQIELDRLFDESKARPVVILKYSPRCSISAHTVATYRELAAGRPADDPALFAAVNVLAARAVSDDLAARTGIRHESPQAIVLRGGKVVWAASHWDIDLRALEAALDGDGP